jgi:hypothetical protein
MHLSIGNDMNHTSDPASGRTCPLTIVPGEMAGNGPTAIAIPLVRNMA